MAMDVRSEREVTKRRANVGPHESSPRLPAGSAGSVRRWSIRAVTATAVIATVAVAAAFMWTSVTPEDNGPKLLHTVARRDLAVTVTEDGTLESSNNTEVRCKVKGASSTIVWIIDNGTEVKPGDVLVRLDTSTIEDNINTQKIAYQAALATYAQSESDVAVARINITEYIEGTYRSELKTKQKDVAIAKANLVAAENIVQHARKMFTKGYISSLAVESDGFALQQAQLELEVAETDLEALKLYTRAKQLQDLEGILKAKEAKFASDTAALDLEKAKLEREEQQLENCVIRAEAAGMAIYGGSEKWEDRPDIRAGATVREDQVLLLIPDLSQMQVKVRIHEAKIDRIKPGLKATVQMQDKTLGGEVLSVASMAAPAGWWNGNMVKYETIIRAETPTALKPGMSATVKIILAQHRDVLAIPVIAVVEQNEGYFCWVKTTRGIERRELRIGDTDDQFLVVEQGVQEGDQVVLNPLASLSETEKKAATPFRGVNRRPRRRNPKKTERPSSGPTDSGRRTKGSRTRTPNPPIQRDQVSEGNAAPNDPAQLEKPAGAEVADGLGRLGDLHWHDDRHLAGGDGRRSQLSSSRTTKESGRDQYHHPQYQAEHESRLEPRSPRRRSGECVWPAAG